MLLPFIGCEYVAPLNATHPVNSKAYCFFLRSSGPGRIQPSTIGTITTNINNQPPILTRSPKRVQKLSGAQLDAVAMAPPFFDGVITSATTLVAEAPTAPASNTGAVPDVAIEAIAPAPNEPPPIIAAFFRLVHPPIQRIGSR